VEFVHGCASNGESFPRANSGVYIPAVGLNAEHCVQLSPIFSNVYDCFFSQLFCLFVCFVGCVHYVMASVG